MATFAAASPRPLPWERTDFCLSGETLLPVLARALDGLCVCVAWSVSDRKGGRCSPCNQPLCMDEHGAVVGVKIFHFFVCGGSIRRQLEQYRVHGGIYGVWGLEKWVLLFYFLTTTVSGVLSGFGRPPPGLCSPVYFSLK